MRDESVLESILNGDEEPKDLPLALLQDITNDFSQERKIGQGGFGEVYKGILRNGALIAVKRIHINQDTVDDKLFRREFNSLWKANNHQNVVRFLGFCSNSYHTSIVKPGSEEIKLANVRERLLCFEYINNGSLDRHITDELRGLEWETRYDIITGICKGLCHLKEKNVIHMDLKPANILLDDHMVPKITDFGLSRPKENSHTTGQRFGTRGYLAPEYDNAGKTSVKSDIYSLGAIIIELVTGSMGVPDKNNVLRRWRHRWSKPPTLLQYQQVTRCIDIAVRCRQQEPGHRPSVSEIISTLTESESTDGQSDQIGPCFNEDDMLRIKPLELQLPSELKEISCFTVELTNDTRSCIAFNIQLPSRQQYIAQPDRGIVQPESKYGVKITVQARDAHEHDHTDKFIVQSMKLGDGLRDKVITESMFHEEAGKVVDEVNLMVVYEPTKPPKNFRSRGDTNMPAEEVPEAKKRKIVESASGKGKLGSSEEVDAASMDINSSARGKCIKQTEQCNLYPLQSFSRCCPTNMKYLGKESDRAVDVTRGAMGSLLDKLGKLVTEDYNLEKSMKRDIEFFSQELTKIHLDLPKLEKLDGVKIWVNEVREMSYNIEDMVDSFLVHVEPDSSRSGFRELTHEGLKLLENDRMTHREIGDVIRDIKNQVQAVLDRQKKYNFSVNNVIADPTAKAPIDPRRAIYANKKQLVGIEARTDELISLFEEDGDVPKRELRVIPIVGMAGMGKTTLARAVYDKVKAQYHSTAFVTVGQNPDVKKVLMNILYALGKKFDVLEVCQLIDELRKLLKDKRYFIVIDDIWDSEAWGLIQSAFPENGLGSTVITTTRIKRVALATCKDESKNVYRMKPLNEEDSRRLFLRRVFGSEEACPDTPRKEEISKYILKKCGGMPLAINSIAGLLVGEKESTWECVWKSLGAMTEGDDVGEIGDVIRDIKNQVQDVANRQKKCNLDVNNVVTNATVKAPIGIEARRDELIRMFEEDGDVSKQELKIVSIVGLGGLGKTTLAKAVYDKLKVQYHSRAFVSVGQNPDVKKVLMNILITFGNDFNVSNLEVWQLKDKIEEFLKDKRYFIVIDDIWDSEAWGLITSAFPRNNHGSRVITTTRIERVARACCEDESKNVYRMEPLNEEDSRRLFLRRIFGPGKDCPDAQKDISNDILKRCGGMPLAINSIASLLAGEPESTWDYLRKTLGAMIEGNDLEKMKQILDLSYIHLPDHLKTCLLHVCMYPEDREIDKNDLLRQWVAEGFVITNGRLDAEDVAEKYFKELINMCMIQPGKISYNNEVLSCRVHDIILDLMRSKSSEENFIHVIDASKDGTGEIRRVSVQYIDKEDTKTAETINEWSLSHVRSVLLCQRSLVPYFLEFKYVRVLHVEHEYSSQINDLDLTCISRLFLLRYLKIACITCGRTYGLKLPNRIGKLQQLETIDIAGAILENPPSDIVSLPWLSHLSLYRLVLPDGIHRLKSLRTLEGVCLHRSSVENIKGISKLTNLRKLQFSSSYKICELVHETTMDALYSSICKLPANLRAFTVEGGLVYIPDVPGWTTRTPFPRGSHIRELDLWDCRFQRCPEWIGQLHGLYKLSIRVREVADGVSIVARLASLAYFRLGVRVMDEEEEKEESVVIPGTGCRAFRALKHLCFDSKKASLTFEAGAMPMLEQLDILFRHDMTPQLLPVGIQHLPTGTLKEIRLSFIMAWDAYREHETSARQLLEGAFKPHHPAADIIINHKKL